MKLSKNVLTINSKQTVEKLTVLLRSYAKAAGAEKAIVGMSGGVDSSVTAALASLALGGERVVGVLLPEGGLSSPQDNEDAFTVARQFGISHHIVDISATLKQYTALPVYHSQDRLANGNLKARMRMAALYYFSNRLRGVVVGTSNRSELLTGYFTKYGDGASDVIPLASVYKTQVYQLAAYLKIPEPVLRKRPTAGLWPGQFDEDELGVKYETLDLILYGLEHHATPQEVATQLDMPREQIERVRNLLLQSEHKRRGPVMLG
ncbi:MAG: NAD+ synthase [Candidatus Bathyarchaeia archaeon]